MTNKPTATLKKALHEPTNKKPTTKKVDVTKEQIKRQTEKELAEEQERIDNARLMKMNGTEAWNLSDEEYNKWRKLHDETNEKKKKDKEKKATVKLRRNKNKWIFGELKEYFKNEEIYKIFQKIIAHNQDKKVLPQ